MLYNEVMNNDTVFEFEDRSYVNPNTNRDEILDFIDTYRSVQDQNTAQINQDTYNLGSPLPNQLGGLGGAEGQWRAQYQTPNTQAAIADLRATAQAQALNQELSNLQNMWQNRYKQAYRNAKRRAKTASNKSPDTFDQGVNNVPLEEGTPSNINQATGEINAVVSGPAGTTAIAGDNYTDYYNDNGEVVRHYNDGRIEVISGGKVTSSGSTSGGESVNDTIKRLESSGRTVTNKRITADDKGNVVLNWRDQNGNEGSETIKVNINYRGGGIIF